MILGNSYLRNAASFPDRIALDDGNRTLSHGDFLAHTIRIINALVSGGAQRQDRVAVLALNSIELVEILAAAELGGFIVLPFNNRLAVAEIVERQRTLARGSSFISRRSWSTQLLCPLLAAQG